METFVWDKHFITGVDSIDNQHRQLVDLFNELNISMFDEHSDRERVINDAFKRVIDYTHYHFEDEEQYMVQHNVDPDHIKTHKAQHKQFVDQIRLLWAQREMVADSPEIFIGFLTSWLGMHILGIDQSLVRQIDRIQAGVDPARALELEGSVHDNSTQALLKMINKLYQVLSFQNAQLAQANVELEGRVRQRTEELAKTNDNLLEANRKLEIFSRTDGLLQIANRGYFDDHFEHVCAQSHRDKKPVGLLMIDVDFFKRYNDTYGHLAGDECLKSIARAVQSSLQRKVDLVARYGGEELVVVLPDTPVAGVRLMAQRVVAAVADLKLPHKASDAADHVTVSVGGISTIAQSNSDATRIIAAADAALYEAKNTGRNRYCLADDETPTFKTP